MSSAVGCDVGLVDSSKYPFEMRYLRRRYVSGHDDREGEWDRDDAVIFYQSCQEFVFQVTDGS
jgi:hypothetical protein